MMKDFLYKLYKDKVVDFISPFCLEATTVCNNGETFFCIGVKKQTCGHKWVNAVLNDERCVFKSIRSDFGVSDTLTSDP